MQKRQAMKYGLFQAIAFMISYFMFQWLEPAESDPFLFQLTLSLGQGLVLAFYGHFQIKLYLRNVLPFRKVAAA